MTSCENTVTTHIEIYQILYLKTNSNITSLKFSLFNFKHLNDKSMQ